MSSTNIEFRQLRHIVTLADTLNYSRAAEELGLTQSALSRSIQNFEQHQNTRLFDRDRGGVHLTVIGGRFVERARQVLRQADDLGRALQLENSAEAGEVAFGMAPMPAKALLGPAVQTLLTEHSGLLTRATIRRAEALLPLLQDETIEFFVSADRQVPETLALRSISLGKCILALMVRPKHPLLAKRQPKTATPFPLLVPDFLRGTMGSQFTAHPALAGPQHLIEDYGTAARITAQTDAIWVASRQAADEEIRAGLLEDLPAERFGIRMGSFPLMMHSLSQRTLSPGALRLKSVFQQRMRELADRAKA